MLILTVGPPAVVTLALEYFKIPWIGGGHLLLFSGAWIVLIPTLFEGRTGFLKGIWERGRSFVDWINWKKYNQDTISESTLTHQIREVETLSTRRLLMIADLSSERNSSKKIDFLKNSAIDFQPPPFQETQNSDLFRTDEASVINTAWDYVNQDKERSKENWLIFFKSLGTLRRSPADTRKKGPIFDAVMLIVDLEKIVKSTDRENLERAADIREQIQDLAKHLGIRLPIYMVVTKCDTIKGFTSFLQNLTSDQRKELVWGFALNELDANVNAALEREGDILYWSLFELAYKQLRNRALNDSDLERDTTIYLFPERFKQKWEKVKAFANTLFTPQDAESPMLRGVYFTAHEGGTSYFTHRLLKEIFNDQNLVRPTEKAVETYKAYTRKQVRSWLIRTLMTLALVLVIFVIYHFSIGPAERPAVIYADVPMRMIQIDDNEEIPVNGKVWHIPLPARGKLNKITIYPESNEYKSQSKNVKVKDNGQIIKFEFVN